MSKGKRTLSRTRQVQTTPEGLDSTMKNQEYKSSRLHDNTSRPFTQFLFQLKEPGEGSGAAGVPSTEETFQIFYQNPPAFCSINQEGSGAALNECKFLPVKRR
jgi:hypothetical protein